MKLSKMATELHTWCMQNPDWFSKLKVAWCNDEFSETQELLMCLAIKLKKVEKLGGEEDE